MTVLVYHVCVVEYLVKFCELLATLPVLLVSEGLAGEDKGKPPLMEEVRGLGEVPICWVFLSTDNRRTSFSSGGGAAEGRHVNNNK